MKDDIVRFVFRKTLSRIEKFRNIHKGQTCYIFGDGPSIKWFDLSLLGDHVGICCGSLPFHKDFDKLNVKYLTLAEPWFFVPKLFQPKILHGFRAKAKEYKKFIKRSLDKDFFINLSNRFSLSGKNINYVFRGLSKNINKTDELLGHFDLFNGSFRASRTLAYYLGFSKIYLVGFDAWTIQPTRNIRFYELGEGELSEATNFDIEFLNVLKREIDIYTISAEGQSNNVKNISYLSHTGKYPVFRENYEIMDKYYLKIMASYPKYRIFEDDSATK